MRVAKSLAMLGLVLVAVGIVAVIAAASQLPNGWRDMAQDKRSGLAVLPLLVGLPMVTFAFARLARPNR